MRLVLFSLVVMAWALGPIAGPTSSAPVQKVNVSGHDEFDAVRAQAIEALQQLRRKHEQRLAMASASAL
jgi:hypothetical protein